MGGAGQNNHGRPNITPAPFPPHPKNNDWSLTTVVSKTKIQIRVLTELVCSSLALPIYLLSLSLIFSTIALRACHIARCLKVQVSVRHASRAQAALCDLLDNQISDIKQAGTWKDERVINTMQASEIGVQGQQYKLLNFCANNYLGLSVSQIISKLM